MRKLLAAAFAASLMTGAVMAADPCNTCAPSPCAPACPTRVVCPPQEKWIDVCETIQVQVPVTEYVDEPCEVQVTRMEIVEEEVPCMVNQWTYETKQVCEMKTEVVCEEYTVDVCKTEYRTETRTRKVPQIVCEEEERVVKKKVCEEVCDPNTGKMTKVWREECETVMVPVKKKIMVDQEYECKVKVKVNVPVTKTRQVKRQVPVTKEVRVPKCVQVPSTKIVKVQRPVCETKTVMRKKAVCTMKTVEKQVTRRVKVPVEPVCPPAPAPGC